MTTRAQRKARAAARNAQRAAENAAASGRIAPALAVPRVREKRERKRPARRMSGLDWLITRQKITRQQHDTGQRIGEILTEAARAEQPGKGGLGDIPTGSVPAEVADWRLKAVRARKQMLESFAAYGMSHETITALVNLCHYGFTLRDMAMTDPQTARLEGRVQVALDTAKIALDFPRRLLQETTTAESCAYGAPAREAAVVGKLTEAATPYAPRQFAIRAP